MAVPHAVALPLLKFNQSVERLSVSVCQAAKSRMYGDNSGAAAVARAVLVYVFDRVLRLGHPFMPFVTEQLWQALPHRGDRCTDLANANCQHGAHQPLTLSAKVCGELAVLLAHGVDGDAPVMLFAWASSQGHTSWSTSLRRSRPRV